MNKILLSVFFLFSVFCVNNLCSAESISDHVIKIIDDIDQEKSISLFSGIQLNKIENHNAKREFPSESVVERLIRFVDNHEFSIGNDNDSEGRSSKLKKILIPTLLALKLKTAFILPVVLIVISLVAFKALLLGTLGVLFSGFTLVKDLMGKKQQKMTASYVTSNQIPGISAEIVTDWNRNGQEQAPVDIAYNGYANYP